MTEQKEKESQKEKKAQRRCNKCGSTFGYVRIKTKSWICRSCGHEDNEVII